MSLQFTKFEQRRVSVAATGIAGMKPKRSACFIWQVLHCKSVKPLAAFNPEVTLISWVPGQLSILVNGAPGLYWSL